MYDRNRKINPEIFKKKFEQYFDELKIDFIKHCNKDLSLEQCFVDRLALIIDYNCHGGKYNRGFFLVDITKKLADHRGINFEADLEKNAYALAAAVEILQASFLVSDDISDNSELRRGKPCWYRVEDVKMAAVNDAFILESFVYFIIHHRFSAQKNYLPIYELFREIILKTQLGQMIDLGYAKRLKTIEELVSQFSKKNYETIITNKTAYYTFYIPIASAMLLCGMNTKEELAVALKIAVGLGKKFQVQDDYMDCFYSADQIGKVGLDIEENKCSWLVVNAVERATIEQKQLILNNYGIDDKTCRDRIQKLYEDLDLKALYLEQEKASYEEIKKFILENSHVIPSHVVLPVLEQTHMRQI